jgi:ABC-type Co2+ transport system permease subunit
MVNFQEITKKIIKYLVEGLIVALACFAIPKQSLDLEAIGMIALVAAMTFSILDVYIPSMGESARNGTGLGIGLSLSGWRPGL